MAQSNESVKGNHYCTQCEYKTTLKYYIKQHVESEHVGIFYNCDGCGYKAKTKTYSFYNCDGNGYKATQKHIISIIVTAVVTRQHKNIFLNCI